MSYSRSLILLPATNSPIYVTELGRSFADEPRQAFPQIRSYYILHIITGGVLRFSDQKLGSSDALLLSEGLTHSFSFDGGFDNFWIGFCGTGTRKLLEAFSIPTDTHTVLGVKDISRLAPRLTSAFDEISESRDPTLALSLLLSLLPHLDTYKKYASPSIVERAAAFMDTSFAYGITMEDVADVVSVSEKHLCKLFVRELALTPKQYLIRKRMTVAKELLLTTDMRVGEIAYSVGYPSALAFSSAYKGYFSLSPTDERNKNVTK